MKLDLKKNKYTILAEPTDKFLDMFDFLCGQRIKEFPHEVEIKNNWTPKDQVENALIAIYQIQTFKNTESYYPEEVEDSSNFLKSYKTWEDVPCTQRYVNHRLKIISDPEFLLICWSKGFESFDQQNNALLPGYPKSMTNIWFTPLEIKEVCRIVIFEWCIKGLRSKKKPLTLKSAHKQFKENYPIIYDLVYTKDGYLILETVYEMILVIDKDYCQSLETRKKCHFIYKKMVEKIKDKDLQNYFKTNDRIGIYYVGMPNPKINWQCILTLFFTFKYFYFPKENIYHLDPGVLRYIDRIKKMYNIKFPKNVYEIDYDPKKKENVMKPIYFDFYIKRNIIAINKQLGEANFSNFFETLTPILFCMMRSNDPALLL